jgi:CheY-like chemotaxis protein
MDEGKLKIILAEDDEFTNEFLCELLEARGDISFKSFENGRDLLEEFKKNAAYDLVLLDIQMPFMSGIECLPKIKEIDKDIPVVALTAYALKGDKEEYLNAGFDNYMSKPLDIEKFYKMIYSYLKADKS